MTFDFETFVALVGWGLAVAATVTTAPQAWRIFRRRETAGVSVGTTTAGIATMTAWTAYTAELGDIPALASSVGPLAAWAATLAGVAWVRRQPWLVLYGFVAVVVTATCATFGFARQVAVTGSVLWALPQLRVVLRGDALHGVSAVAYTMIAVENVGWVFYAFGTSTWAYAIAPLVQGPVAAIIAWRTARSRRKSSPPLTSCCDTPRPPLTTVDPAPLWPAISETAAVTRYCRSS
jgi:uncharacterized protein with PQ loop repeat